MFILAVSLIGIACSDSSTSPENKEPATVKGQVENTSSNSQKVQSKSVDAAATLRADIKAMSNSAEEDVKAAFVTFNSEIEAIIQNDTNIDGELFVSANSTIDENSGAKASLESSIEATLDLSILVAVYTTFYSEVESIMESTFSNASETEAEAYAELLILINVAT
jgi:hypothetical protein